MYLPTYNKTIRKKILEWIYPLRLQYRVVHLCCNYFLRYRFWTHSPSFMIPSHEYKQFFIFLFWWLFSFKRINWEIEICYIFFLSNVCIVLSTFSVKFTIFLKKIILYSYIVKIKIVFKECYRRIFSIISHRHRVFN